MVPLVDGWRAVLAQEFRGDIATVFGYAREYGLVQPHVHLGGIAHQRAWTIEFCREFFACGKTAVDIE